MSLTDIIIDKIKLEGLLSFRDFMETCLYFPGSGYYSSAKDQIGKAGDFYTSPYFPSLFGQMIARQLEEMWELMGKGSFTILEYGAGPGTLCHDILLALKKNDLFYRDLRYCIIEKSASMRNKERVILNEKVSWYERIEDIPDLTGCIISNELIDNFPVHQVIMKGELMEVFVDYQNGFTEVLKPASDALKTYLEQLQVNLPEGFRTEINLEAVQWIRDIAQCLKKGFILTIDYGFPSSELYSAKRRNGTLMCYYKHSMNENPFLNIGEQDITAHVNFSALAYFGSRFGLQCSGFINQAHFLQALGLAGHLKNMEMENPDAGQEEKEKILFGFLLDLGARLKVLIQQKGIEAGRLSGLQFAQAYV